jgi:hypothetical protein
MKRTVITLEIVWNDDRSHPAPQADPALWGWKAMLDMEPEERITVLSSETDEIEETEEVEEVEG